MNPMNLNYIARGIAAFENSQLLLTCMQHL
jgi:hypothetical protein